MGSDLCDIRRIERSIARFGDRFLERAFTPVERAYADRRSGMARIGTYAKRWAAKEACAKALGTGFNNGVFLRDIGVRNRPGGAPMLELTNGARAALGRLVPARMQASIVLTMTDEVPYAMAQVLIQALPAEGIATGTVMG
ncbi:holo-[acyl-carrier protein] synthase [Acidomonas methanolica]|nr:holo-ACP synthase [Acidomonas methanolica]TCS30835.1 holo-[acyl-carrier protein] synthase [Acidomonas methanolica]